MIFSEAKLSMLTFPGVILRELIHSFLCKLFGVEIKEVCYLRYGDPAGYIIHGPCHSFVSQFMITITPFFVHTIFGGVLCYKYLRLYPNTPLFEKVFFVWLGISFLVHSFPSKSEVKNFNKILKKESEWVRLITYPLFLVLLVFSKLSYFWIEALYAWVVVFYLPNHFAAQFQSLAKLF